MKASETSSGWKLEQQGPVAVVGETANCYKDGQERRHGRGADVHVQLDMCLKHQWQRGDVRRQLWNH